jgi:large subunit ribosomal protein L18
MKTSLQKTARRAKRLRHKIRTTGRARPRLSVFRSGKHISVQLIDDVKQVTLAAASSQEKAFKEAGGKTGSDVAAAALVGKMVAERALKAGVKQVVFDRGAFIYHGRVKALADAAREGGLDF